MATMDPGQRGFGRPMRRQGPVDRFDEAVGEDRSVDRKRLLALLMSILSDAGRGVTNTVRGGLGQQLPMGGRRQPMGGGQPRQRRPMGGGQQPVVRMEDLLRALNRRGAGAPQADMPVPQARR